MSALNTQTPTNTNLSTEHVIANHISVQAATELSGYNAQYLRRLLRAGKLDGMRVGQVWLIDLISLQAYLGWAIRSNDLRCGPKAAWQPQIQAQSIPTKVSVDDCKRSEYTNVNRRTS